MSSLINTLGPDSCSLPVAIKTKFTSDCGRLSVAGASICEDERTAMADGDRKQGWPILGPFSRRQELLPASSSWLLHRLV